MVNKNTSKRSFADWEQFLKGIREDTATAYNLSDADKKEKLKKLESNPVQWAKEMFPGYAKCEFASFQRRAIKRILSHPDNWYEVLSWARELAKSTIVMFIVLYLVLTGKKKNIILCSSSSDNASRLLVLYRGQLDANARIRYYYGNQKGTKWADDDFLTAAGASFKAIGAGQSPRGNKNEAIRPDVLLMDDYDTDEECRNPEIIRQKFDWFEQALYFTRSFSEPLLTIWCGNIIAKDCCVSRAGAKALELAARSNPLGHWDIINIRMVDINKPNPQDDYRFGTSVWPAKNSESAIDDVLAQVSMSSAQKECYNNPVTEGKYFTDIKWGTVPPLSKFKFLVSYGDPAPSNRIPSKRGGRNSFKANFIVGVLNGTLYVITGFLDHVVNDEFISWYYHQKDFVKERTQLYNYIENNKLQDPFYEQVFKPLFLAKAAEKGYIISITPDARKKPEKFTRIEGALEPLNRSGQLVFNVAERGNPHMKRLEDQFLMFDDGLPAPADGPDAIEGGYYICQQKLSTLTSGSIVIGQRIVNKKRY